MGHPAEYKLASSTEGGRNEDASFESWGVRRLWIKTIFAAILQFIHIGFLYNFGLFFDKLQHEFHISVAVTGWVGSISYGFFTFGTVFSTWSLLHLSLRKVAIVGVLLGSISLIVSSFSPTIIYVIVSYGIFFGLSSNISMITSFELAVALFQDKRRARAMIVIALGATIGNLSMSNLIEFILDQVGWRWTFRIFSAVLFIVGIFCCTFFSTADISSQRFEKTSDERPKTKTGPGGCPSGNFVCFLEVWLFSLATLTCAIAIVFQYVFTASFLESIGLSEQKSATGITLLAFGDTFAKVVILFVAPHISFPLIYCLPVSLFILSMLSIAFTWSKNTYVIFAITICYGLPRGVYNGLQLPTGLEVFGANRSKLSANIVLVWSGIGNLAGPIIHGSLFDLTGSYYPALYLCAVLYLLSSITMLLTPLWQKYFAPDRYMVDYRKDEKELEHSTEYVQYV